MWWLLLGAALAGNKWEGHESDVFAERTIPVAAEAIWAEVDDVHLFERLLPAECLHKLSYEPLPDGTDRVLLTYKAGPMRRKLSATRGENDPGRWVDYVHPEPKGFTTRIKLEPADGATKVTVRSFLNPPPWPFRGVYFSRVRPAWITCWQGALQTLETRSAGQ